MHRLSAKSVEKTKEPGYYSDGGGLYLQVSSTLSKSWIFLYRRHGKSHEMGLGSERDVSLAEARTKASDARRQIAGAIDPLAAREGRKAQEKLQKAGTVSFAECAKKFIASHRAGWRNEKHAEQWQNSLDTYAGLVIGELAVKDVDTALVLRVLEPIWSKKPETASRVRGRVERILDYARVRGYRSGENPARWRGHLDKLLPSALNRKTREHHAALPYDELPAFMKDLRSQGGNAARALELLILTTARTGEIIGCEPEKEIDLKKAIWTIPAGRMKAGRSIAYRSHRGRSRSSSLSRQARTFSLAVRMVHRSATWQCSSSSDAWAATISPCIASARPSAIGRRSARPIRATYARWRSRTRSATRSKRPTDVATCSKSGVC
jgi:integrase